MTGADAQKIVAADRGDLAPAQQVRQHIQGVLLGRRQRLPLHGVDDPNVEADQSRAWSPSTAAGTPPTSMSPSTTSASPAPATRSRRSPPKPRAAPAAPCRPCSRSPRAGGLFGPFTPGPRRGLLGDDDGECDLDRGGREALGHRSRARPPRAGSSTERSRWPSRCRSTPTAARTHPVGGSAGPTELLNYDRPISNDAVTVGFKQASPRPRDCAPAATARR